MPMRKASLFNFKTNKKFSKDQKEMAATTTFHARSNSLPARLHPLVSEFDEQVCRLRQSQAASTSSSSSSIGHNLTSLQDLYDCVDKFLQLQSTQQSLIGDQKSFNEALDGSLRLLDLCNAAKDALSSTKESVFELQSAIRRRQGGDLEGVTKRYIKSRKFVKQAIQKVLTKKSTSSCSSSQLGEVEAIVVEVLERLLSFVSGSNSESKSWSLVSKVMRRPKVAEEANINEFAEVDASLRMKKSSCNEVHVHLKNLLLCIQDLEEGVECLFRRLIKTRAYILNIYNV